MTCEIRELRCDELEEALQFARQYHGELDAAQVRRRASVLARDEQGGIAGAAFCIGPSSQRTLEVVVSPQADPSLLRRLVDKALLKLRSENVRRCVIHTATDDAGGDQFWSATRWIDTQLDQSASAAK
ncbi:MAG: hypothetical protein ACODAQ_03620 [Phycisphaeraceae bacterium]